MKTVGFHCTALCRRGDDHQLNMRISVTSVEALLAQNQTVTLFYFFVLVQLESATSMKIGRGIQYPN
jgi:hypothetical protein